MAQCSWWMFCEHLELMYILLLCSLYYVCVCVCVYKMCVCLYILHIYWLSVYYLLILSTNLCNLFGVFTSKLNHMMELCLQFCHLFFCFFLNFSPLFLLCCRLLGPILEFIFTYDIFDYSVFIVLGITVYIVNLSQSTGIDVLSLLVKYRSFTPI